MAGTDRKQSLILGGPAIVLVGTQLAENIGSAARAMLNFGLGDLRLVEPQLERLEHAAELEPLGFKYHLGVVG